MAIHRHGEQDALRRQFITDCVEVYIRNNPVEFLAFQQQTKEKREKMLDATFGQLAVVRSDGKLAADDDSFRHAFSIPEKLWNALSTTLNSKMGEEPFGEPRGEMAWFAKTFPEFLIPSKY